MQNKRWVVLLVFTLVAGVNQMLWLNFAPILSVVQTRYGVNELTASALILVFPLLYVAFSLYAGSAIDRLGYRRVVGSAALAQAVFACLRIYDKHFWVLLVAQIGVAIAQPFIVNGISKLVADWFDEEHSAVATGIGTMGMFIGMAAGLAATPALHEAFGMRLTLAINACVAVAAAIAFVALCAERGVAEHAPASDWNVLRAPDVWKVLALSFLGLGFFNGLTTWLEQILASSGIDSVDAGLVGGVLILGGIVGAGVVPAVSDRVKKRKPFLLACSVAALALVYPLCTVTHFQTVLLLGAALGFFFLPAYAILLEMCVEITGAQQAGFSTGVLMLLGNAGGVIVSVAMALVKAGEPTSIRSVWVMVGCLSVSVVIALSVKETYGRLKPQT